MFLKPQLASAGSIAVYWGQHEGESSLSETCSSNKFRYVIISFLCGFGNSQPYLLNLANHCDPSRNTCKSLSTHIKSCQNQGIKVFLSLGGAAGSYFLNSDDDAEKLADYLWDNYLGGHIHADTRPFGSAVLDGIDLDIEGIVYKPTHVHHHSNYNKKSHDNVLLTAAPQCPYPDVYVGAAIATGLFDYLWVQFYNNAPCQYSPGSPENLVTAWHQWVSSATATKIFLGLPASSEAAGTGFIPASDLIKDVLPKIKASHKYGGVMLWSKYYDHLSGYSNKIHASV
ncbi:Acidic endochitinase [Linum perenne]